MDIHIKAEPSPVRYVGKRKWRREETLAFIHAYSRRKDEFINNKKKKYAMHKVLDELRNRGVLTEPTTVEMLKMKLRSLLRAYQLAKANAAQNGVFQSHIPFAKELEELFGDRPMVKKRNSIHLREKSAEESVIAIAEDDIPRTSMNSQAEQKELTQERFFEEKLKLKKQYYERKLQIKQRAEEQKEKRFKKKMEIFEKFLNKN